MVLAARGAYPAARSELLAGHDPGVDRRSHLRHHTDLAEAEILLAAGDLVRARVVLTEAVAHCPTPNFAMNTVPLGRLCLAEGDAAAALEAVTPCLEGCTADTRLVDTIGAHLVAAVAHRRLGRPAVATEHLETALALSEPDQAIRVFLTAGRTIRSLLTMAVPPSGPFANLRAVLLHHFETQSASRLPPLAPVQLTASEAAVLRYLPLHLTNEEIADDLCLSVNTVKSHLRTLYRKLGAVRRREAIARARQLGLLSM
jgi:LuxR family maltose regulon positive regulatory protein